MRTVLIAGFFAWFALIGIPSVSVSAPLEDAQAAFDRGEFGEAFRIWSILAQEGGLEAQHQLYHMHSQGRGVPHDNVAACMWLLIMMRTGDEHALHEYSMISVLMTRAEITEAKKREREWRPTPRTKPSPREKSP